MTLGELGREALVDRARDRGLCYRTGPFIIRLLSDIPGFLETLVHSYTALELLPDDATCHYHIRVHRVRGLRRWAGAQVQFSVDGIYPFEPYPLDHAFPMFEWGLNWCFGTTAHQNLMLHSAVVEKSGRCVILPANPGSGKSTLCAGLVSRGWRLLSDEFGIIRHRDGMVLPLPRAAPLKNQSIGIIREFAPALKMGPVFERTRKGTVSHMLPPADSLLRQAETVEPGWIIFPKYVRGAATALEEQRAIVALTRLVNNSFNYPVTREAGFRSLTRLVRQVQCYQLLNGDLGEAVSAIEALLRGDLS